MPDEERVRVGIYVPQLQYTYEDLVTRARLCDELGFDSLWLFDHLYGAMMPDLPAFEAWTLATALLTETERLRVGHMVLCATFRHPALLAKMATTLDVISGGRLNFGIGSGSVEQEHHEAGIPWRSFAERSEILEDTLEIVTRMFAGPRTTYDGRHFQVRDLPNVPGPVQQPRPPVYVGGVGEQRTLPLVARFADVWNVPTYALDALPAKSAALDAQCARIGRESREIRRSLEAVLVIAPDDAALADALATGERRFGGPGFGLHDGGYVGTPSRIVDRIGEHRELGFTEFVFFLHDRAAPATLELIASEVLPQLD
ncbi:MAG: LLM class flavin-dependent oxidoreductase [Actinomycetota bacterium]